MIEPCFQAFGFKAQPVSKRDVYARFCVELEKYKDSTPEHRARRRMLREALDRCYAVMAEKE